MFLSSPPNSQWLVNGALPSADPVGLTRSAARQAALHLETIAMVTLAVEAAMEAAAALGQSERL